MRQNTTDFNLVLTGFGYSISEEALGVRRFMKAVKTIQKG